MVKEKASLMEVTRYQKEQRLRLSDRSNQLLNKRGLYMSVMESRQVDGIATTEGNKTLVLLITDHLDWNDEYNHLIILQDKINSYIEFIELGQYRDIEQYKGLNIKKFVIEISFKNEPTEKCLKFISSVNNQLNKLNIIVNYNA